MKRIAGVVGKLWASPNTLAGLCVGTAGYLVGRLACRAGTNRARPYCSIGNNAIQFHNHPALLPRTALALGNTISYAAGVDPDSGGAYGDGSVQIGRHEKAHTLQSEVLGIFFLPAYLLAGGFTGPAGNRFESAAQEYGRGGKAWWPFPLRRASSD